MKKKIIFLIIILLIKIIFLNQNAFCQDVLGQRISTDEFLPCKMDFNTAIKYSLEHNNNIRALKKNLSATERDIGIERSVMLPKLRFNENFTATNNPTDALSYKLNQARATPADLTIDTLNHPPTVTNFLTTGVLEQRLWDRKAMIEIKMAKKEYSANGYAFLRKQEELVHQVAQAYLKVSTDKEYIVVDEQSINDTKAHYKVAEERYKKNPGLSADYLRAKTAIQEKEERLIIAQRTLKVDERRLGLLLGLEASVEPATPVPNIQFQDMDYYKCFSVYRNDIKAMELRVENSRNNVQANQADWYPTLSALGSYSFYNSNYPFGGSGSNYLAGAFFRWEPLDGNKRKYEILKAKDKEAEIKEYLEGLKKTVAFKVYEYYTNILEHQRNLELAIMVEKEAVEDVKRVEQLWRASKVPYVSLIDAQRNLDEARLNIVKEQFDLKANLITLSYESGIIYQELGLK